MKETGLEQEARQLLKAALVKVKEQKAQLAAIETANVEPIAIIGLGCRFPGGANSPEAYWELLRAGQDAIQLLDPRWVLAGRYPGDGVPRWAGLLTTALDTFDAAFFGISPREARTLDPQQRLLLEISWEALENAGIPPRSLERSRTGVFVGAISTDYLASVSRQPKEDQDAYSLTGNLLSVLAGRLSYTLGLQGPCMTVDTACSSSLVAIHLACRSLRTRESNLALAGGVNVLLSSYTMEAVARTQALSPDGRCKTFDAAANGFVRGEGCGLLVLKRLSDAQRDGDRIWALIRGSAVNQDGRSTGLTAPNVLAQEALLRDALQSAQVAAGEIGYVETHGTGTSLGDPIEVEALRAVMGPPRGDQTKCVLGAVKTNIGHLEGAAGVAGVVKAVLALWHELIPENLNFRTLNAHLEIEGTALALATKPVSWPRGKKRRYAGVSGFGLSGTNAHVVLEEAPLSEPLPPFPARPAELVVMSAKSEAAMNAQAGQINEYLQAHPELTLGDVAYSIATTRNAMEHRVALIVSSREGLQAALASVAQGQPLPGTVRDTVVTGGGKLAFLFTGQGAQLPGMGRGLYHAWSAFREPFVRCMALFDRELECPLREVMWALPGSAEAALLNKTGYTQPALFVLEYSLYELWRSWGVIPDMVAGHSIGELVAACAAGVLSLEDAVHLCAARGRLMQALPAGGAMLSISASEAVVAEAVAPHATQVAIAAVNGPEQVVIAGAEEIVAEIGAGFASRGVRIKSLQVSHAFHSPLMAPMLEEFRGLAASITHRRPMIPLISNVSGKPWSDQDRCAEYWVRHVREAVRFSDGVKAMYEAGASTFLEVGPKATLLGLVPGCLGEAAVQLHASLREGRDDACCVLEALGGLWTRGCSCDWTAVFRGAGRRVSLPTYSWQRLRYWVDAPVSHAPEVGSPVYDGGHPLLGKAQVLSTQTNTHLWETTLDVKRLPWLGDHLVQGAVLFPAAAFAEMALSCGLESLGKDPFVITDLSFIEGLVLTGDTDLQVVTTEEQPGRLRFQVASRLPSADRVAFRVHVRGMLRRAQAIQSAPTLNLGMLRSRLSSRSVADVYTEMSALGLAYGPAFQGILELWRGAGEALGRVHLPQTAGSQAEYQFHPALLDACFQVIAGFFVDGDNTTTWVPVEIDSVRLLRRPMGELWCHARFAPAELETPDKRRADLWVFNSAGVAVAEITGFTLQRLTNSAERSEEDEWLLGTDWESIPVPAPKVAAGRWLLLGQGGAVGSALRAALEAAGHAVVHSPSPPLSALECRALLTDGFSGKQPTAVVHVGSLGERGKVDATSVEAALVHGSDSVLCTVQALTGLGYRDPPRLWLVTRGAHAVGGGDVSVAQAPLIGLGRVIAMEHAELRCGRIDLDPGGFSEEVKSLLAELLADDAEEEVAIRGGERRVARLVYKQPHAEQTEKVEPAGARPFRLELDKPGVLDHLMLRAMERRVPGHGEVEIAVEATGLNFLDILLALGVMPNDMMGRSRGPMYLGCEFAGRIVSVGEGVLDLAVGDPVVALAPGAFASFITTSATLVLPRPRHLSAPEAASMPIAYLTAYYALEKVARLQRGERILIHAATGGVGLAAVQWAQHVGAEIYATAGTPEKRAYLKSLGVRYVSDSRSDRFVTDVHGWTGGEGVDVVLNSLSGEMIEKSFNLLRDYGRFIEIGKRDYYANSQLGLRPFLRNLSFALVDLRGMMLMQPARLRTLFAELLELVAAGTLSPRPMEIVPIGQVAWAFRKMAQAQHVGKLVISMEDPEAQIHVLNETRVAIRSNGSYLVTGGLGGLGLSVAGWLAEQGAGCLILIGRSGAATAEQKAAVAALEAKGARVIVIKADVANRRELEPIFRDIAALKMPLRGIVHAAGILDDGLLTLQTPARFRKVMAPKGPGSFASA